MSDRHMRCHITISADRAKPTRERAHGHDAPLAALTLADLASALTIVPRVTAQPSIEIGVAFSVALQAA